MNPEEIPVNVTVIGVAGSGNVSRWRSDFAKASASAKASADPSAPACMMLRGPPPLLRLFQEQNVDHGARDNRSPGLDPAQRISLRKCEQRMRLL